MGYRSADRGRCAPEIGFRLATLTLARRVGADSSPIHSAAQNASGTCHNENARTELAAEDSLYPISCFAVRGACLRGRQSVSHPPPPQHGHSRRTGTAAGVSRRKAFEAWRSRTEWNAREGCDEQGG
jgi:hypothetical protein